MGCTLPWGYGWGWVTLPNGIWNGALTWSQCDDALTLHALPATDCTNIVENGGDIYHHIGHNSHQTEAYESTTAAACEDGAGGGGAGENYDDYAVDCDFGLF